MTKMNLKDHEFNNKRVLVRCDFNVPIDEKGIITDDKRIISSLPTINYLLDNGAKVILLSHLGRPKGKANKEFSLNPIAKRLSEHLNKEVIFLDYDDVVNNIVKEKVLSMKSGDVIMLQNTRYRKEEESNDPAFSKDLAELGEIFVNDAFGTSHRAHSSNVGISNYIPSCLGLLVEKEVSIIGKALDTPEHPFIAILGGAKISDKISVIDNLISKVDSIIIGGGMTFTFLKAMGYSIGQSLLEDDKVEFALSLINKARSQNTEILLPIDIVVADSFSNDSNYYTVDVDSIPDNMMGLDIGEKTIKLFSEKILEAKTIIWNGPMGVFEMENFSKGTNDIAKAVASSTGITIVGGGDSALAIEKSGYQNKITHISTGGGASLEFMEGKILPGISAISDKTEG